MAPLSKTGIHTHTHTHTGTTSDSSFLTFDRGILFQKVDLDLHQFRLVAQFNRFLRHGKDAGSKDHESDVTATIKDQVDLWMGCTRGTKVTLILIFEQLFRQLSRPTVGAVE